MFSDVHRTRCIVEWQRGLANRIVNKTIADEFGAIRLSEGNPLGGILKQLEQE